VRGLAKLGLGLMALLFATPAFADHGVEISRRAGHLDSCLASLELGAPAVYRRGRPHPATFREPRIRRLPAGMPPGLRADLQSLLDGGGEQLDLCRDHLLETVSDRFVRWGFGAPILAGLGTTSILAGQLWSTGAFQALNGVWAGLGFAMINNWEWRGIHLALRRHRAGQSLERSLAIEVWRARARGAAFGATMAAISAFPAAIPTFRYAGFGTGAGIATLIGQGSVAAAYAVVSLALADRARRIDEGSDDWTVRAPALEVAPFAAAGPDGTWVFGMTGRF
jgi:hypothetical protein